MRTAIFIAALVVWTLPASGAYAMEPEWEACFLRDALAHLRDNIAALHNGPFETLNRLRNWRDRYAVVPDWFADRKHSEALGVYDTDSYTVAAVASANFSFSRDALTAALDSAKPPEQLYRVFDMLWPITGICPKPLASGEGALNFDPAKKVSMPEPQAQREANKAPAMGASRSINKCYTLRPPVKDPANEDPLDEQHYLLSCMARQGWELTCKRGYDFRAECWERATTNR